MVLLCALPCATFVYYLFIYLFVDLVYQDIILTTYVIWERESCGDDRTFLKRCGMIGAAELGG